MRTFARYTERTAFERPLTSGVAYAIRVLHSEREHFEKQQGWLIKRMDTPEQIPVHKDEYDSYDLEVLEPSPIQPIQEEHAPVIFAQDTVAHVVSINMLSVKMLYSPCDAGNYFVIPGSPAEACEVDNFMVVHQDNMRDKMNFGSTDFIIAIVGNQLLYGGLWLEHALVLQALLTLFAEFPLVNNSHSHLKVIVLTGDSTGNYSVVLEAIAMKLRYPIGTVKHIAIDEDVDSVLSMVDLVIYGSFLEDQSFPDILKRGTCFEKPILAPDLSMIKKYVFRVMDSWLVASP